MSLAQKVLLNTSALTVGRLALAVSGVIGVAIATRYLGPADYAGLVIATVFISITILLTDLGLYTIATREIARDPDSEARVLANVLGIALSLTAVAIGVSLLAMVVLYGGEDRALVRQGILLLLAQVLVAGPAGTAAALLNSRQRALPLMAGALAGSVVFLGLLLAARLADWGFAGVALAQAAGAVVGGLLPVAVASRTLRVRVAFEFDLWRRLFAAALPQGGILILGTLYFRIDLLLLSFLDSDTEVALYGVAYKVVEVLTVLPLLVMFTLFPELARSEPHSERLRQIVQSAFTVMQVAALPCVVYFVVLAGPTVEVVGGERFAEAAPVLQILMISVGLVFLNTVYFNALVALGRQRTLFAFLLAILAVNVVLNLFLIPLAGARGAAVSVAISEVAALVIVTRIFRDVGTAPGPYRPAALLAAAAAMAAVLLGVAEVADGLGPLPVLALGGALGGLAYAGGLVVLRSVPGEVGNALGRPRPGEPAEPPEPLTGGSAPGGPSLDP